MCNLELEEENVDASFDNDNAHVGHKIASIDLDRQCTKTVANHIKKVQMLQ